MSEVRAPTRLVAFRLGPYRGEALAGAEAAVHTQLLPEPMERALEGRVLRKSNARRTARVSWSGVGPVLLKVHRVRSLGERLLSLVRTSRARAEWDAARYLRAVGAPVPQALAVGESRSLGLLQGSFFAARFLEGLQPVHDALPILVSAQQEALHCRLARLIRALHERGFDHRDLHSGNVLAGPGPGESCRLVVTDLHRCTWGREVSHSARVRGVAQWLHSVRDELDAAGRSAWLRAYLPPAEQPELARWERDVHARIVRFEHVRLRSRGKRSLKESTVYTRDVGTGWGGRRRALPQERLEAALRAHDAAVAAQDERVAKRGRRGVVTCHGDIVVKERLAPSWSARVRDAVWPRRHAAGYQNAHRLTVREVGTALPLAHVRRGGRSWTLYEDLSRLPRLDHLARAVFLGEERGARASLLEASARWVGRLHADGVYHGDLKGVNVLVEGAPGTYRFHLIDTDHCRFFPAAVDRRRRIKNLAQLAASIPACVTRADRARWYACYAEALPGGPGTTLEREALCREVDALVARKIVVVDEPIE
jgi:tRNA A-37 threonylcarbamoyl transferase component Bud32